MRKIIKIVALPSIKIAKRVINTNDRYKNITERAATYLLPRLREKDTYQHWLDSNFPDYIAMHNLSIQTDSLGYKPLLSIVVPTYDTNHQFLHDCIESLQAQVYDKWEMCIVDDASPDSGVRALIEEYAAQDERIKYKFLKKNRHIAGATNEAFKMASGEFVGLFDHDDVLWPNALLEVVKALNDDKKIDFLYSDEDKISENRHDHFNPFFKPDWNPDFLHSVNYITHFAVIRTSLLRKIGGLRKEYNGAQDWDLFMRLTSATDKVHHIPKVLYSWRVHDLSTAKSTDSKPYVVEAQRNAIQDDIERKGYKNATVEQDSEHLGYWKVSYKPIGNPLVSIVIPSKDQYKIVKRCVDSIYQKSTYSNFEIILVDTGSKETRVLRWYERIKAEQSTFKVVNWHEKPFSYARSCNEGARVAKGEILIMLNNDTEVITPDWIEQLVGDAQRKEIGAVGCLLFFPDKHHIQHAGVGVGLGGVAANSFSMMTLSHAMSQTQHLMINTKHNMTAVTAACMAIRSEVFKEIGGFDETFRVTYNDVDLCLRLYEKGYQNIYTPHVRMVHHESISVGLPDEAEKRDTKEFKAAVSQFKKRWAKYIEHDPNINQNLDKSDALYNVPRKYDFTDKDKESRIV